MRPEGDDGGGVKDAGANALEDTRGRGARVAGRVAAGLMAIVVIVVGALLVLTNTDWGRERVRRQVVSILHSAVHGRVQLGRMDGNLLRGIIITDLSITDSGGAPLITADSLSTRFSLMPLLGKRIVLHDMRLVRPLIVLDRPPEGEWNFARIFPSDTAALPDSVPGWGSWLRIDDLEVVDGRAIVRLPWEPDSTLTGTARDSAIAAALGPDARADVRAVAGGWQTTYDFQRLSTRLPELRIADPAEPTRLFRIATLTTDAYPFRPPAAEVRDLRGNVHVATDSVWFDELDVDLPASHFTGAGTMVFDGRMEARLRVDPVSTADLRWVLPTLPTDGRATLDLSVLMDRGRSRYVARNVDATLDSATLAGDMDVTVVGDTLSFTDTELRVTNLHTSLVQQFAPTLELPVSGTVAGRATLNGPLAALDVDADVTFLDSRAGRNRALARGTVGWDAGVLTARALRVELRPMQVALAHVVDPTLPIDGVLTGTATLDGSTATSMTARFDISHAGSGGFSRLAGRGSFRQVPELRYDVDARLEPFVLATADGFAPELELRGDARGPVTIHGSRNAARFNADLTFSGGGTLQLGGEAAFGDTISYAVDAGMAALDVGALTTLSPGTSLTGTVVARGTGFDPGTMHAAIAMDLSGSRVDTVTVDSAHARVTVAEGLARIDTLAAHGPATLVTANGDFGLRADREGTLTYHVAVDSLGAYAALLGISDTTLVAARPRIAERALAAARADSARIAIATEVQRMATGAPPPRLQQVEEIPPIPRDSVGGSLLADGFVKGNLEHVDVRGRAAVNGLVLRGSAVEQARSEYAWVGGLTPQAAIVAALDADSIRAAGLSMDGADLRVTYQEGRGTADLFVAQGDTVDYQARATFRLATELEGGGGEIDFQQLALRIDTTSWVATRETSVRWGKGGVVIDSMELTAGPDRRIFVDGVAPVSGDADLTVSVRGLGLGDISQIVQSDIPVQGLLDLEARVTGSAEAPVMHGETALNKGAFGLAPLPDIRATFDYSDELLSASARLLRQGDSTRSDPIATAVGTIPVNLAMQTTAPRLPDRPMRVDIDADSLPLALLGQFSEAVTDVDGQAAGSIRVRGTVQEPDYVGALTLSRGRARLTPVGVDMRDMSGLIRLVRDTVLVDSLVAFNDGSVLVRGKIGIAEPTEPSFDLYLVANRATILDNEQGRLHADAGISMRGPFDRVYVSGAARITEGVIFIPASDGKNVLSADDPALFAAVDTSTTAEATLLPQPSPLLQNLQVDMTLGIDRDTWVRSSDANVEIFTPEDLGPLEVQLDQQAGRLVLNGVVSTERGEYTFLSKRFQVDRGSVIFTGSTDLNPLLQVTALYDVKLPAQKALTISVLIGGTLNNPQLSLESDAQPPLSQSDLISYLAFGRTSSSLLQLDGSGLSGGNEGGSMVGAVGAAATQRLGAIGLGVLVDQLEGETARSLGADVVNITPADLTIEASNPFSGLDALVRGTQVELGKYFNRNTFVSLMVRPSVFSSRGENRSIPGIRVQHRFGAGFSLDTSFEGRYVIQPPTLESNRQATSSGVFGLFLSREWGW